VGRPGVGHQGERQRCAAGSAQGERGSLVLFHQRVLLVGHASLIHLDRDSGRAGLVAIANHLEVTTLLSAETCTGCVTHRTVWKEGERLLMRQRTPDQRADKWDIASSRAPQRCCAKRCNDRSHGGIPLTNYANRFHPINPASKRPPLYSSAKELGSRLSWSTTLSR
jgi:hypothetical protein